MKYFFTCSILFVLVFSLQSQTISTGLINGSPFCAGGSVAVPFTITGTFNANNIFRAQLSDINGNFGTAPLVIGTITSRVAGTINSTIPINTTPGSSYKIRVVSTNQVVIGAPSSSVLQIKSSISCSLNNAGIDDLRDVVITSPSSGQGLVYNGVNWINGNLPGSGTTVNGMLKGNGTSIIAAVSGTDYAAPNHNHSISDITNLQASLDQKVNGWSLTGNTGLNETINFIGTTDDNDLTFKVYNVLSGKISSKNSNTSWGRYGLVANTSGYGNTANGFKALYSNTTGNENTALGLQSLASNSNGFSNTAIGSDALYSNSTGYENTAVGKTSMYSNISGTGNTAVGVGSLYSNNSGRHNTAIGAAALTLNTEGNENIAIGVQALYNNTTGFFNTSIGVNSMLDNTLGYENVAIGKTSMIHNKTGSGNTAVGVESLYSNSIGRANVAIGGASVKNNTEGIENTGVGSESMFHNNTGNSNAALGNKSLFSNTSGRDNVAIGSNTLMTNQTGNSNTAIGYASDVSSDGLSNATAIGSGAIVNASNKIRLGNTDVTVIEGQVAMTTSDGRFKNNVKEDVPGLSFIMKLKPVTYNFKYNHFSQFLKEKSSNKVHLNKKETQKEMGLIAQDVEKVTQELGLNISNLIHVPENENDNYALSYGQLVVPLIKAIQEQQKTILDLKKMVEEQGKKLESLGSQTPTNQNSISAGQLIVLEDSKSTAVLGQNIPNPSGNRIVIPFKIPADCNNATIVITNTASGNLIKSIPVSSKETQLNLDVSKLVGGSYNYTLYINGKVIDTKTMIKAN